MPKYDIVKASSYDPAALADQLTEKSTDGWKVVAIVPTGGDITAFLEKDDAMGATSGAAAPAMAAAEEAKPAEESPAIAPYTPEPVAEPAGWGVAPESSTPAAADPAPMAPIAEPTGSSAPPTVTMYTPSTASTPAAATPPAAAVPSVPAGWYADPSGRYEQRYWDGGTWTEHVARGGAQFTDPPVA